MRVDKATNTDTVHFDIAYCFMYLGNAAEYSTLLVILSATLKNILNHISCKSPTVPLTSETLDIQNLNGEVTQFWMANLEKLMTAHTYKPTRAK